MPDPSAEKHIKRDAKGQFARSRADRQASGVASAKPTVLTEDHSEDATVHAGPDQKRLRKNAEP